MSESHDGQEFQNFDGRMKGLTGGLYVCHLQKTPSSSTLPVRSPSRCMCAEASMLDLEGVVERYRADQVIRDGHLRWKV